MPRNVKLHDRAGGAAGGLVGGKIKSEDFRMPVISLSWSASTSTSLLVANSALEAKWMAKDAFTVLPPDPRSNMSTQNLRAALDDVGNPDFTLVMKTLSEEPCREIVQELSSWLKLQDVTDPNDDVCFHYLATSEHSEWGIELSAVGRYANFLRSKQNNTPELVTRENATPEERPILETLERHGFLFLSQEELETPILMKLFSTDRGRVKLYQALFSDTDLLPWEP
jgi:hypothetical protein